MRKKEAHAKMEDALRGVKEIAKRIDVKASAPLACVKRDEQASRPGARDYATDTEELDGILKRAWGRIYKGNLENIHKSAAEFVNKYKDYVSRAQELEWEPITA